MRMPVLNTAMLFRLTLQNLPYTGASQYETLTPLPLEIQSQQYFPPYVCSMHYLTKSRQ